MGASQAELVQAVAALRVPTVLVVASGGAISLDSLATLVPAILQAWMPGVHVRIPARICLDILLFYVCAVSAGLAVFEWVVVPRIRAKKFDEALLLFMRVRARACVCVRARVCGWVCVCPSRVCVSAPRLRLRLRLRPRPPA